MRLRALFCVLVLALVALHGCAADDPPPQIDYEDGEGSQEDSEQVDEEEGWESSDIRYERDGTVLAGG